MAVQAIFVLIRPSLSSMSLRMPNWSFSIHSHIFAETMVGIAQGIRIAARTMPRPLNSALRTSATIMPNIVSSVTEISGEAHRVPDRAPPDRSRRAVRHRWWPRSACDSDGESNWRSRPIGAPRGWSASVGEAEIDRADKRPAGNRGKHDQHRDQENAGRAELRVGDGGREAAGRVRARRAVAAS